VQSEREHIGRLGDEVALAELVQFPDERGGQPPFVQRVKRLPRRQLRRLAAPGHSPGAPRIGFELQDPE
jgi:hypothetical protein